MDIFTSLENLDNHKNYLALQEQAIRFLNDKGYQRIDLPVLSPALIPESYLEVFETELKCPRHSDKLYLTPSLELFLKRLLHKVPRCYTLGKSFRNSDPNARLHSFEFTMLEFYRTNANYMDIADEVIELVRFMASQLLDANRRSMWEKRLKHWKKITVEEAFVTYAGLKKGLLFDTDAFRTCAKQKGYSTDHATYEDLFSQMYAQEVEPNLIEPNILYDYPIVFASLAKPNPDGRTAARFEFYIDGVELGDCYSELTDWKEQQKRFESDRKKRNELGRIVHPVDNGLVEALKYGLPECSGIAIGFERLAMVLLGLKSISDLKVIQIV